MHFPSFLLEIGSVTRLRLRTQPITRGEVIGGLQIAAPFGWHFVENQI